jgi:hypothetical protein
MADTGALVVVRLIVSARDIAIAIGMMPRSAFLADVVGAAHERWDVDSFEAYNSWQFCQMV